MFQAVIPTREIKSIATSVLEANLTQLQGIYQGWPRGQCAPTCDFLFEDLQDALHAVCDWYDLEYYKGWFDTAQAGCSAQFGDRSSSGHAWLSWCDVIIDPTASQFLPHLPAPLLVATRNDAEYGLYHGCPLV